MKRSHRKSGNSAGAKAGLSTAPAASRPSRRVGLRVFALFLVGVAAVGVPSVGAIAADGEHTLEFTHFANGTGTTSELVFVNVADYPIRPAIYFYGQRGDLIIPGSLVDVIGDLEIRADGGLRVRTEMDPFDELTITTHGLGELVSGSVKVVSNGPISGLIRYSIPDVGVTEVGAGRPLQDALLLARRRAEGISTAVALHNLGEDAIAVDCLLMSGGVTLDEAKVPLESNGQTSWLVEEVFTGNDLSDFLGSVRCTAPREGRFSAIAVEIDPRRRIFNTLSVVPLDHTGDFLVHCAMTGDGLFTAAALEVDVERRSVTALPDVNPASSCLYQQSCPNHSGEGFAL